MTYRAYLRRCWADGFAVGAELGSRLREGHATWSGAMADALRAIGSLYRRCFAGAREVTRF